MDLSKILSIAGKPGLYQIVNQSRGGVVAKSLLDGKKVSIGQTQRVSTLSDISIYVEDGDEPLVNILKTIYESNGGTAIEIDLKDADALRNLLREALPEHDEERVYTSDIKKIVKWYNLLHKNNLLDFSEKAEEEEAKEETIVEEAIVAESEKGDKAEAQPAKKAAAKQAKKATDKPKADNAEPKAKPAKKKKDE